MRRISVPMEPDKYGRVCIDCKQPLFLLYDGALNSSQSLWKLTDKGIQWVEKYTESGKMYDDEGEETEEKDINDSLAAFILLYQDQNLDVLDINTLPQEYHVEFNKGRKRGFFDYVGGSAKAGRYILKCINKKCPGQYKGRGNPSERDPRGMIIHINDDGSQDRLQTVEKRNIASVEGYCPFDGSAVIKSPAGLMCTDCGRSFARDKMGRFKNILEEEE